MVDDVAGLGITIDPSGATRGIRAVESGLDRMATRASKSVGRTDSAFTRLRKSIFSVRGVLTGLGAGLVLRDSIKTVIGFEKSIANLSAITGATGKDLEFLAKASRELGAATTLSASQAATAFKLVASAKPDLLENAEALKEVTKQAVTLAEAASITLPDAARILGASLNQFSADASEAGRFINVMAEGARLGSSEIVETAEAMKAAGTVAAAMGVSFEGVNSVIQQLAKVAIKGSDAGTGLRNVLLRMESSSNEKLRPSMVGLGKAFQNLRDMQLPVAKLNDLFGLRAIVVAQQLVKEADSISNLSEQLEGTNTAFVQAEKNFDTLEGDLKRLGSALEELKLTIFGDTEVMRDFIKSLTRLAFFVTDNVDKLAQLLKILLGFAAARFLGPLLGQIGVGFLVAARNAVIFSTRLTLAQKSASILRASLIGLRGLMALLGGPAGLLILGATAMLSFGTSANKTESKIKGLNRRLLELRGNVKEIRLEEAREELRETEKSIEKLRKTLATEGSKAFAFLKGEVRQELKLTNEVAEQLRKNIEELSKPITPPPPPPPTTDTGAGGGVALTLDEDLQKTNENFAISMAERFIILEDSLTNENILKQRQFEADQFLIKSRFNNDIISKQSRDTLLQELELQHQAKMGDIEAIGVLTRRKFEEMNAKQRNKFVLGQAIALTQGLARHSKIAFEINKLASMAQVAIKIPEAAQNAYTWGSVFGGPIGGAVAAGLAITAGIANLDAIRSQSFGGGGGAPSLSTSAGTPVTPTAANPLSPAPIPTAPQVPQISVNLGDDDELISKQAVRNLIKKINQELKDGANIGR